MYEDLHAQADLPSVAIGLLLPIAVMVMIAGILYVQVFGFSASGSLSADRREDPITKEMRRLAQPRGAAMPPPDELSADNG